MDHIESLLELKQTKGDGLFVLAVRMSDAQGMYGLV
jgi:hypothetical protein